MDIYEILYKWNLWGEWQPFYGKEREICRQIMSFVEEPEVITIIGPRRAGKSTVMYQIMQSLIQSGISETSILHINFEEPALASSLDLELLDNLYQSYKSKVNPTERTYIFLDEIQNVPDWERWVRSRNEKENIKIIITGSSSKLLSQELGTLLTGRHLSFDVYPLSFKEQLIFNDITIPKQPWPTQAPAVVQHALNQYLMWGGMPRVVLSDNQQLREQLLTRYFEDILYKDVIMRHDIRDLHTLRNMAVFLLTQTGSLVSYQRLSDLFNASHEMVKNYCHYLQNAFLIKFLDFYTLKTGERVRKPMKAHAIDLGLRRIVSFGQKTDECKLIESMVYRELLETAQDGIFYWRNDAEIDLLTRQGITITQLLQVTYAGLDNLKTFKREIGAFDKASQHFPDAKKRLIVYELPKQYPAAVPDDVEIIPLWQFLLASE